MKQKIKIPPGGYSDTNLTCKIVHLAESSYGKYAQEFVERTVIMELAPLFESISEVLPKEIMS